MTDRLIINARPQLDWWRRLLSDVVTVILWVVWLYLWMPAFHKLQEVIRLKLSFEPAAIEVLETVDPISISHSLIALIGTCALLLLWTLLPKRRVNTTHAAVTLDEYAGRFSLTPDVITRARGSRISIVHHDEDGAIVRIEIRR